MMRTVLFWTIGTLACISMLACLAVKPERPITAMAFGFILVLCMLAAFTED